MIEQVTYDQERFLVPTLRMDSRGLVIGERGAIRFGVLPDVVAFFQALTEEQSLDHVASSLRIVQIRGQVQGLEFLVDLPTQSSFLLDRAAQMARLRGGQVYTGSWPHFVPYRDLQSPCGYDARQLDAWTQGPVFYDQHGAQRFAQQGEFSFESLLLRLSLSRVDAGEGDQACHLRVRRGLRAAMQSFLTRRGIQAQVAALQPQARGRFDQQEEVYLFHIPKLSTRLFPLLESTPGVEVYRSLGRNLFVERGWEHRVALENCRRFFRDALLYFFCGSRDTVDLVESEGLTMVNVRSLEAQRLRIDAGGRAEAMQALSTRMAPTMRGQPVGEAITYQVRLAPQTGRARPATAVLIDEPREVGWLKKLVYAMPRTALEQYRAAFTKQGVLVVNERGVERIPIGLPLYEYAPGVLIPCSKRLSPAVGESDLREALAIKSGWIYLMPTSTNEALRIEERALRPLVKHLLADIIVEDAEVQAMPDTSTGPQEDGAEVKSQPVGRFALWHQNLFRPSLIPREKTRALPAQPPEDKPSGSSE